jgi:hypothetical protein
MQRSIPSNHLSSRNKEAPLTLSPHRPCPLNKLILNRQSQSLTRGRAIHIPPPPNSITPFLTRFLPIHHPRRPNRLPQRKEHRTPQKQRRLTNTLATLHTPEMVPRQRFTIVVVAEERSVEDLWDAGERGNLVGAGPAGV